MIQNIYTIKVFIDSDIFCANETVAAVPAKNKEVKETKDDDNDKEFKDKEDITLKVVF